MAIFCDFIATKSETLIFKSEIDQNRPKMQFAVYFGLKHFLNVLNYSPTFSFSKVHSFFPENNLRFNKFIGSKDFFWI